MKKKPTVAVFLDPWRNDSAVRALSLYLGADRVRTCLFPEDFYGVVREFRPDAILIDPDYLALQGISSEDIAAWKKTLRFRTVAYRAGEPSDGEFDSEFSGSDRISDIVRRLPTLCTRPYIRRSKEAREKTRRRFAEIFDSAGFSRDDAGYRYLFDALTELYFDPTLFGRGGARKIYAKTAEKYGVTPRAVEQSIVAYLERSWTYRTATRFYDLLEIPQESEYLVDLNFGSVTRLFYTYYVKKYGTAKEVLRSVGLSDEPSDVSAPNEK